MISPDTLVISEEFSSWDKSERRIDLLGIDKLGRIVVVELKRTTDDSHVDLQALRYAAMVSKMTFDEAVDTLRAHHVRLGMTEDAQTRILEFLGWSNPSDGRFGEDVRIILAAPGFTQEVTSTVLWLNEHDLDFRCVKLQPYLLGTSILLDVQQIIPLPEAVDYQIQLRQKQRETRSAVEHSVDWTRYDVQVGQALHAKLYKREVILITCTSLVEQGHAPEQLERVAGRKLFEVVDGEVDGLSFRTCLLQSRPNDAHASQRFFAADEHLLRREGKTYAVSNQWSKATMVAVMDTLLDAFPSAGITYSVTRGAGA